MNTNIDNIKGRKVLVVGLGKSGIAAVQAMVRLEAEVYVQDSKKEENVDANLRYYLEEKGVKTYFNIMPPDMSVFDMLILSPGVSPELPFIKEAEEKGAEIIGELEIAYRAGSGNYVAITGTNGKTTTTTLTGEIFKKAGRKTYVVGNIGTAVISASLDSDEDGWMVTETSSFQLETTKYFKPVVSAILNITPDHLNRHHTMEAYKDAKAKIFENQTSENHLVINYDDKECFKMSKECRAEVVPFSRKEVLSAGVFVEDDAITVKEKSGKTVKIIDVKDLKMIGMHNLENALAATGVCYYAGIEPEVIASVLRTFTGVEHRIEFSGEIDNVKYYNDSKGTNTDATITALRALEKDIILIAGGDAKGQNFDELLEEFSGRVKHMILLGRDAYMIQESADKAGFRDYIFCKDMDECVRTAAHIAEAGDKVLLSPACASWDMYDNFEQRGEHFKNCVMGLEK